MEALFESIIYYLCLGQLKIYKSKDIARKLREDFNKDN
jgi:hypothetical protein